MDFSKVFLTKKECDLKSRLKHTQTDHHLIHEPTGITASVSVVDNKKKISLKTKHGQKQFIFNHSEAKTIKQIAQAMNDIVDWVDNLK